MKHRFAMSRLRFVSAFYLFGLDNKQRIAFENLLISILPNTSKVVPLSDWKTPSGRVKSWGYDVLVFNDITLKSLTTD